MAIRRATRLFCTGIRLLLPASSTSGFRLTNLLTAPGRPRPKCPRDQDCDSVPRLTTILSRLAQIVKAVVPRLAKGSLHACLDSADRQKPLPGGIRASPNNGLERLGT